MLTGGMVEFRRSLAASFLFRFVVHVNYALAVRVLGFSSLAVQVQSPSGDYSIVQTPHTADRSHQWYTGLCAQIFRILNCYMPPLAG